MNSEGLSKKLALLFLGVAILFMAALGLLHFEAGMMSISNNREESIRKLSERLVLTLRQPIYEFAEGTVKALVTAEFQDSEIEGIFIWTANRERLILGMSRKDGSVYESSMPPSGKHIVSESFTIESGHLSAISAPIARFEIYLNRNYRIGMLYKELFFRLAELAIVLLILTLVLIYVTGKFIVNPIDVIKEKVDLYGKGEDTGLIRQDVLFKDREISGAFTEIKSLAGSVSNMAVKIEERQKQIKESEERFRTLSEQSELGTIIVQDKEIKYVNEGFCRMSGYSEKELKEMKNFGFIRIIDEMYRNLVIEQFEKRMRKAPDALQNYQVKVNKKDGTAAWATIYGKLIQYNGSAADMISIVDISGLKTVQEDLQKSNEELEKFAYVASHDMKEPLRTISVYTQLLNKKMNEASAAELNEYIGFISEGTERMRLLIEDLLAYSRIEHKEKEYAVFSSAEACKEAAGSLKAQADAKKASIKIGPLPDIKADRIQIGILLQNLISNALKFTEEGKAPEIEITAEQQSGRHIFCVKDNGIGIEPKYFDKIFAIFERLHSREKYEGTGVGLAICKKIVERHGGRIWVVSEAGKGAAFYFSIPS